MAISRIRSHIALNFWIASTVQILCILCHKSSHLTRKEDFSDASLFAGKYSWDVCSVFQCNVKHHVVPNQSRFQSRKSAVLQLDFIELSNLDCSIHKTFKIGLDYAQAIDKVPFNVPLSKLSKFGIDDEFLQFFSSYFNGRHQLLIFYGSLSNTIRVISGVPRGSVLSPLLFNYSSTIYQPLT